MFKEWIRDIFNLSVAVSDDVNIDVAKANYQKYQDDLKRERKEYIKTLCNEIKTRSRRGRKSVQTLESTDYLMTPELMMEIKEYFEQRGFRVIEKRHNYGVICSWLEISWDEEDVNNGKDI